MTIQFSYSPTSEGANSVIYPITSNDPQLNGIQLSGTGYDLVLASEKFDPDDYIRDYQEFKRFREEV